MTLYKTVPVTEDNIPEGEVLAISKNGNRLLGYIKKVGDDIVCDSEYEILLNVTHYLLPVGEENLRRLCEGVWDICAAYHSNIDEDVPDKPTAITSLIQKFLKDDL